MTTSLVITKPNKTDKRRYSLDLLILLFGASSWLLINSTYLQLPLLVERAPEGWSLASFIVIAIQLGNVMPLFYNIVQYIYPVRDSIFITILLLIGITGSILFGFYYDTTAFVLGENRSVAMLFIVFTFALVGCTSSVLFMPYMGRFQEIYLITYLVGEGLSGLIPSLLALGQGVGGNTICRATNATESGFEYYTPPPRFSIQTFFGAVSSIFTCCTVAFLLIDRLPTFKKQYSNVDIKSGNDYTYDASDAGSEDEKLSKFNYGYLMILMSVICFFTNGFFPSTQTYSVAPYGNLTYHWAIVLTSIANPAGCFIAFFLPNKGVRMITTLTVITGGFAAYVIATSLMSPPPMHDLLIGQIVIVISWTCLTALHSYVRLSINSSFRNEGGRSLVWIGSCQQIGSLIGSIVSFLLIQYTTLFKQYDVCADFTT